MVMMMNRYKICELFGIPIYVNISFAILLLIFVMDFGSFTFGVAAALALAVSVTLHELGHALTARAFGYRTNDITLSLLGGCASLISLPRKAWQEFLTAAAGPFVSFALGIALYVVSAFLPQGNMLGDVLWCGGHLNIGLGCFNLLPGFPMDGGRIFRSVMQAFVSRPKATLIAMWVGRAFAILLALRGVHSIFSGGSWGFISILIAWMIWKEGYREYQQALRDESWNRWTQDDFNARVSPLPYDR